MNLLAQSMRSEGAESVIFFPRQYPNVKSNKEKCLQNGVDYIFWDDGDGVEKVVTSKIISHILDLFSRFTILKIRNEYKRIKIIRKKFKKLLLSHDINLIVLGGDIVGHDMAHYIQVGHKLGIRSVLAPQWFAGPKEPAETISHLDCHKITSILNRIFAFLNPEWRYSHFGIDLIRLPAWNALVLCLFRVNPPNPWVLHSGYSDLILAESEAAKSYAISLGIPESKITVTGSICHDIISSSRLDFKESDGDLARTALCALPPNMFYDANPSRRAQFETYDEMINFWVQGLKKVFGDNFLICIHPSSGNEVTDLLTTCNAPFTREGAVYLIAHFDVYIASISATIQWAIAKGIPVINYDVYRYNYPDYQGLDGVVTVFTKRAFMEAMMKISFDDKYYDYLRDKQSELSARWGLMDGAAHMRIYKTLKKYALQNT